MPNLKTSYAWIRQVTAAQLPGLADSLKRVAFSMNSDTQVLGMDREFPRLTVQLATRQERDLPGFDAESGRLVVEKGYVFRELYFSVDTQTGVISTPAARRDLGLFVELLKRCGAEQAELGDMFIDLVAWSRELFKMYDTAQLMQLVVDSFYAEPKLLGRYTAKTVDNRIEQKTLEDLAGQLRSLRFGFFYQGVRRTVEARVDGVLALTSGEEDDLISFAEEQQQLYLRHAARAGQVED